LILQEYEELMHLAQRHLFIRTNCLSRFRCPTWTTCFSPSTKKWRETYCFN